MSSPAPAPLIARTSRDRYVGGFAGIEHVAVDLMRKVGTTAFCAFVVINDLTRGHGREWADISLDHLGDMLNVSSTHARGQIELLKKLGMVEPRPRGRGKGRGAGLAYRLCPENINRRHLSQFPDLPRRTCDRRPASPEGATAGKTLIGPGCSSRIATFPSDETDFVNDGVHPLLVTAEGSRARVRLEVRPKQENPTTPVTGLEEANPVTPVAGLEALREFLTPIFRDLFGKQLDEQFLQRIHERLAGKPLDHFRRLVQHRVARARSRSEIAPGLFLHLADDCAPAERKIHQTLRPPAPFVSEPEESGSIWMQIRLACRGKIDGRGYDDWLAHTAYSHFEDCELHVRAADGVTVDWLQMEYGEIINQTIRELNLPVKRIVYHPEVAQAG